MSVVELDFTYGWLEASVGVLLYFFSDRVSCRVLSLICVCSEAEILGFFVDGRIIFRSYLDAVLGSISEISVDGFTQNSCCLITVAFGRVT